MLILVGIPGAGKSTFSSNLCKQSSLDWCHINQDTVRNGKPGTRQDCLDQVHTAASKNQNIVIDRCNFNDNQRKDFLALSRLYGYEDHAIVFQLPRELCIRRAEGRSQHPTGVHGINAEKIVKFVFKDLQRAGLPQLQEGFRSVVVCSSDEEVNMQLDTWQSVGKQESE
eukprot:TRINITY_DN4387_c0_g1_i2.p15 TRINITY_DN4387_c0_g1~~TRINITY_DN4387_c0_g1_i2.p15  ORF type:complete len:169 (+),score=6.62 TRINITY_DN4387_c0_g1_i2:2708-3214(+)